MFWALERYRWRGKCVSLSIVKNISSVSEDEMKITSASHWFCKIKRKRQWGQKATKALFLAVWMAVDPTHRMQRCGPPQAWQPVPIFNSTLPWAKHTRDCLEDSGGLCAPKHVIASADQLFFPLCYVLPAWAADAMGPSLWQRGRALGRTEDICEPGAAGRQGSWAKALGLQQCQGKAGAAKAEINSIGTARSSLVLGKGIKACGCPSHTAGRPQRGLCAERSNGRRWGGDGGLRRWADRLWSEKGLAEDVAAGVRCQASQMGFRCFRLKLSNLLSHAFRDSTCWACLQSSASQRAERRGLWPGSQQQAAFSPNTNRPPSLPRPAAQPGDEASAPRRCHGSDGKRPVGMEAEMTSEGRP